VSGGDRLAVVPVRHGALPAGSLETVAECDGQALLAGSAPDPTSLAGVASTVTTVELGTFRPARWADELARHLGRWRVVVLPACPDGRDLAPRLAHQLGRDLLAAATHVGSDRVTLARDGGLTLVDRAIDAPVVVTLLPGARGVPPVEPSRPLATHVLDPSVATSRVHPVEPTLVDELGADPATIDLSEAGRVVVGGGGLDSPERLRQLASVGVALDAAVGATRVVTDRGWLGHQRQIGTTGVVIAPELYLAFAVSGAVQHTAGIGAPAHVVSVNTDPYCPMMALADLAVVSDANAVVEELHRLLVGAGRGG
jgi:electron transfer flavoprotein alpha subunit